MIYTHCMILQQMLQFSIFIRNVRHILHDNIELRNREREPQLCKLNFSARDIKSTNCIDERLFEFRKKFFSDT